GLARAVAAPAARAAGATAARAASPRPAPAVVAAGGRHGLAGAAGDLRGGGAVAGAAARVRGATGGRFRRTASAGAGPGGPVAAGAAAGLYRVGARGYGGAGCTGSGRQRAQLDVALRAAARRGGARIPRWRTHRPGTRRRRLARQPRAARVQPVPRGAG